MSKGCILFAIGLLVAVFVALAPTIGAYGGGAGSGTQQYDCGSSCHGSPSSAIVTMAASSLTPARGGSVTVTVGISGGEAGSILGVMIVSKLTPTPDSIPTAAGWTITADPSGSGTDNYYEMTGYTGTAALQWTLTAPQADGTFPLYARAQHGDAAGNVAMAVNNATGLSFTVGAGTLPGVPTVSISSPSEGATVDEILTIEATIQSAEPVAYALLLIDGVEVDNKTEGPFHWDVDTTAYANGEHSISVTAHDTDGDSGSDEVTVVVNNVELEEPALDLGLLMIGGAVAVIAGGAAVVLVKRKKRKEERPKVLELTPTEKELLVPLTHTGLPGYAVLGLSLLGVALFAFMWYTQMTRGLVVTGMRDYGVPLSGTPWGIYIVNFIWFVGIAHGGIVMSAAIRVLKLHKYNPIARMAELLTIVTLMMAGLSIVMDVGRPDRVFEMIRYYPDRVSTSPLVWDLTVIMIYITLSICYLYLLMRDDLAHLRDRLPKFRWLYGLLLFGYRDNERTKIEQIAWWIALTLLVIVFLLSGGVIPWLFGLIASQAGWYGAAQGPMYLNAALASALGAVIVLVAIMRRAFHWETHIKADMFRGLGTALSVLVILYLWFMLHEHLTMQYAAPTAEHDISDTLLFGEYAILFWPIVAMLLGSFAYLAGSALAKKFSATGTVIASAVILLAFWLKRYLIVIPSLTHPRLTLYPAGVYTPTLVEYSLVIGTISIAVFMITLFTKIFPVMEVKGVGGPEEQRGREKGGEAKEEVE